MKSVTLAAVVALSRLFVESASAADFELDDKGNIVKIEPSTRRGSNWSSKADDIKRTFGAGFEISEGPVSDPYGIFPTQHLSPISSEREFRFGSRRLHFKNARRTTDEEN